ncbi:Fic family protein [Asticcacaulis sp.]|uniref:Fic family protein n=1 Tax=Asticcacaulis sp. TaxID=1872648 RepID=UPI003F7B3C8E
MVWNWQHEDWPEFSWDRDKVTRAEMAFIEGAGVVVGASKHLGQRDRQNLSIALLSHEAVDTSAIEGEQLDRGSVQSSIQRQLGVAGDRRRASPAEVGIADMMVDLYRTLTEPLAEADLFRWHKMLMNGRSDIRDIGCYRSDAEPMQIVSGAIHDPKIHFEAPPSDRIQFEMTRFIGWLESTSPAQGGTLPAVTRAAIAHLWFESIHPFEDGNGRIGRAIAEKALAQGLTTPAITGLAGTLLEHRKSYYAALERASRTLDLDEWLAWFAAHVLMAQQRVTALVDFVLAKDRLLAGLRGKLNVRQEKALLRMFDAGPGGFLGGLSAANYISITGATTATTTRDLSELVSLGALVRSGERKSTRYVLNLAPSP